MKTKKVKTTNIVISIVGWLFFGFAVYIDGSFMEEFTLLAISRVLP